MQLVKEETREQRPARDAALSQILEVLFIEVLRSSAQTNASPRLVRGPSDDRFSVAIRGMHEHSTQAWTVA